MAVLVDRTSGVAEIALTIICMLVAFLYPLLFAGLSAGMHRIVGFFSALIVWICYGLAFYVIGVSVSPQPFVSESDLSRSAYLAYSALLFVGLANSMVWRSIPNPYQHLCASYLQLAQMVFLLVLSLSPWSIGTLAPFWLLLFALFLLWGAQERSRLLSVSARSHTKEDLLISDYMAKRNSLGRGDPSECHYIVECQVASTRSRWQLLTNIAMDPVPRRAGTPNLVAKMWREIENLLLGAPFYDDLPYVSTSGVTRYDKLVTVQDIWKHIPASWGGKHLHARDVCLSLALFKLLRRRFRGSNLHESGLAKSREFALQGLLLDPSSSTCQLPENHPSTFVSSTARSPRAFNIIEAELGFLFDYVYGNQLPDFYCLLSIIVFIVWTSYLPFGYYEKFHDYQNYGIHRLANASTISFLFPLLGIWQLHRALSNWHKVNLFVHICRRHKRHSSSSQTSNAEGAPAKLLELLRPDMILGRLVMHFTFRSSLSNQVWQYCLMLHDDSSHFVTREVPNKAKEALVNALVDVLEHRDGVLSEGHWSLYRNRQHDQLSWACHHEFVAEQIIVWHVATTLCHVGYAESTPLCACLSVPRTQRGESLGRNKDENHEVATMLSGYCAYLVGFAPELIADDIYATRLVFNNACAVAMEQIKGEGSLPRMRESAKRMSFGSSGTDFAAATKLDVVSQGKMLAAQLLNLQDDILWKVLADIWAELMLFISPSDNAAAHLEKLKTGGELITHIWALLTHAGILRRPQRRPLQINPDLVEELV